MSEKDLIGALKKIAPYLNKTKLAVKTQLHPNTINTYLKGEGADHQQYELIYTYAVPLFELYKKEINRIELPKLEAA